MRAEHEHPDRPRQGDANRQWDRDRAEHGRGDERRADPHHDEDQRPELRLDRKAEAEHLSLSFWEREGAAKPREGEGEKRNAATLTLPLGCAERAPPSPNTGRASCRERVGKNRWTPGGAG